MLVICVGLSRAASTLQYNIAQDLICNKLHGKDFGYLKKKSYIYRIMSLYCKKGNAILKAHNYYSFYENGPFITNNVKFLCTFRDLREVAISIMRAYNYSFDTIVEKKTLEREIEKFYKFKQLKPILMQNYNNLITNLKEEIIKIGKFLEIDLSENDILDLYERYNINSQMRKIQEYNKTIRSRMINFINRLFIRLNPLPIRPQGLILNKDRKTGLHYNHIAEVKINWQDQLTEKQKNLLKAIISDWLIDVGFEKDASW